MTTSSPLAVYRGRHGLTLEAAGAIFGVNKTTFMRWEEGQVPHGRAREVARVTGIAPHILRPDIWDAPASAPTEPARATA